MNKQSYRAIKRAFTGPATNRNQVCMELSFTFPGDKIHAEDVRTVKSIIGNAMRDSLPPGVFLQSINLSNYCADKDFYSV